MRVTVGVSGGIAAYKAAEVVRELQRQGAEVHVVMTEAACNFVQPLTFAALSGHKVITSLWEDAGDAQRAYDSSMALSTLARRNGRRRWWCARRRRMCWRSSRIGIADDFLTTMYLATPAQVLVAPAMNVNMWEHPATQANLETLRQRGVRVIEPGTGDLACGMVGAGRMAEPEAIAEAVVNALGRRQDLAGELVLVTAGGTREALDPVRFLGNRSSGKMGYAIAEAAQARGAHVVLVSGPTALYPPARVDTVKVTTADEMRAAVLDRMNEATMIVKCAAVADYRPVFVSGEKLKRTGPITVEFEPTEDILAEVVRRRRPGQLIVGFAAETANIMESGRAKLLKKGADAIVVNDVSRDGVGMDADENAATFLTLQTAVEMPRMPKRKLADRILDEVLALRRPKSLVVEIEGGSAQEEVLKQSLNAAERQKIVVEG